MYINTVPSAYRRRGHVTWYLDIITLYTVNTAVWQLKVITFCFQDLNLRGYKAIIHVHVHALFSYGVYKPLTSLYTCTHMYYVYLVCLHCIVHVVAGSPQILKDSSDPRLLKHKPLPVHMPIARWGSEYSTNFSSPSDFSYEGGVWKGAPHPDLFVKVILPPSPLSPFSSRSPKKRLVCL